MKYINVDFNEPYKNFALEEYLLMQADEESYLFFYIHKPSIIVGVHQNTIEEINQDYVEEANITVARRMTGGGAVYHDHGNLNFSFVKAGKSTDVNDFESFTRPIVEVLQQLGAPAELSGRNDLTVEGYKVSGNASCYKNGRILSHGTLLFQANMQELGKALKVSDIKLRSKGVQSVKSRVANLADYLPKEVGIETLKEAIIQYFEEHEGVEVVEPSKEMLAYIEKRANNHFSTWDWNWGISPSYNYRKYEKFPCGIIDVRLELKDNHITKANIYGDFFTSKNIHDLAQALQNCLCEKEALTEKLADLDIATYFKDMSNQEFVDFMTT